MFFEAGRRVKGPWNHYNLYFFVLRAIESHHHPLTWAALVHELPGGLRPGLALEHSLPRKCSCLHLLYFLLALCFTNKMLSK